MSDYPACVPDLSGDRVRLRALTSGDVARLLETVQDPTTVAWTTVPRPYGPDQAYDFIDRFLPQHWADGSDLTWAVEADLGAGPVFAGTISLRPGPPADLGFVLHPQARGRGVMSAAVRLVASYAFGALHAPVLQWRCAAGNLASWRVAWAGGFTWDGEQVLALPRHDGSVSDSWRAVLRPGESTTTPTTRWLTSPVLEAGPLRLRPLGQADVPRIVEACSDPRTRQWLPMLPDPYSAEHAREFVQRKALEASLGANLSWVVTHPDDDLLLAHVSLFGLRRPLCPGEGELGYWAHPDARGRGAVTAAVRAISQWALRPEAQDGLGLHRLVIGASWGNAASRRVAVANGFRQVAHTRLDSRLGDGSYQDGAWYDRLAAGRQASHQE